MTSTNRRTALSKFLSFVLRHEPGAIGLKLDRNGWANVDELLEKCRVAGKTLTRVELEDVVATNPKRRFALSDDGRRIRANQGHSIGVDLALSPKKPPEFLFHGTVAASLVAIRSDGLKKMKRDHVHLSPDEETATKVGMRRGKPIVLRVFALRLHDAGYEFYLSDNGVWLTERVPPEYIEFPTRTTGRSGESRRSRPK